MVLAEQERKLGSEKPILELKQNLQRSWDSSKNIYQYVCFALIKDHSNLTSLVNQMVTLFHLYRQLFSAEMWSGEAHSLSPSSFFHYVEELLR